MAGDKDSHSRPSQALAGWRFASGYTGFYGSAGRGVFSCKQEAAENCRKPTDGRGRGGSGRGRGTALPRVSGETSGAWAGPSPPERLAGLCMAPPGPRHGLGSGVRQQRGPSPGWPSHPHPGPVRTAPVRTKAVSGAGRGRALPAPLFAVAVKGTRAGGTQAAREGCLRDPLYSLFVP